MSENQTPQSNVEGDQSLDNAKPQLSKKEKFKKEAISIFWILIVVFTFRSVFFEPFRIPTGSMIPTLMIGDFILVNKFSYGFKVPFTDMTFGETNFDPIYITKQTLPERGDVVVFKYPKEISMNYIKRVVGLPGDTLEIRNKVIYINDKMIEQTEFDGKAIMDDMDDKFKGYKLQFYKAKTGNAEHVVQYNADNLYNVDLEKIVIPEGNVFVMGDNRDFSYDSRYWGFVKQEYIKGKAMFVWFSFIFPLGENPMKFRPWRIGTPIH